MNEEREPESRAYAPSSLRIRDAHSAPGICADFDAGIGSRRDRQHRRHGLEALRLPGVMPPVPGDDDHQPGGAWTLEHSSEGEMGGAEMTLSIAAENRADCTRRDIHVAERAGRRSPAHEQEAAS